MLPVVSHLPREVIQKLQEPRGISSNNPQRQPACLFLPLQHTLWHARRNSTYCTPHWRLPARDCLILQPQKQLFVWLNLSSLSATVFVSFSTVQYLFSAFLCVCVCVSALFFVCAFPSSEGAEVTKAHLWPLLSLTAQARFININ